jgi:hypothetical protein
MKKLFILLIMCSFVFQTIGQTQEPETVTIKKSDLTSTQIAKIASEEQLQKVKAYGEWVGMGQEIGIAIKEGLTAVVDVSEKFSNTKVGEFTMYLIAWKVVGKDFVRIFLGIIFAVVMSILIFKSLRRMYPRRIVTKNNGWKFWEPKEYTIIEIEDYEGIEVVKILHIVMLGLSYWASYGIMFA